MKSTLAWAAVVVLATTLLLAIGAQATQEQGPYEDIADLLHSAAASSASLASLDSRGAPRVIEIHHNHHHVVPANMPDHIAEQIAEDNTPPPPRVNIVQLRNPVKAARQAREEAQFLREATAPTQSSLTVEHSVNFLAPPSTGEYTIKGPQTLPGAEPQYHFPLVDRSLQRPTYGIIADTDGSDKASDWKPHTAKELQEEAVKLLARAKELQAKKNTKKIMNGQSKEEAESMGAFDQLDDGYEDELTRLKRVSARMNRLREQIEVPHNHDTFEGSIARKKYFLKIYAGLKDDATKIIESYALRTGHSIFELFGDGKIDPSIAAFLPPNSVAAILAQYANPTTGRDDETPRDVISGKDAKRIQYSIDYFNAKRNSTRLPLPPQYAETDAEAEARARNDNESLNKVVATQVGAFGQGRPAVTTGQQAIGRSSVHISVVNPAETQRMRGLPFKVNLKTAKLN